MDDCVGYLMRQSNEHAVTVGGKLDSPSSTESNALSKPSAGAIPRTELELFRRKSLSIVPGQVAEERVSTRLISL
jgi:hypothetical protein